MLQLPTGGGKTRIAGELLSKWLTDGRKAVWLTHRKELAAQTEGMLQEDGVPATSNMRWEPHTNAPTLVNGVVILMAQTVSRRTASAEVWDGYDSRDLMIIDEAHHATADGWARAMSQWPGPVLGMTATPWRLSKREGFDHLFEDLICGPQVAELQSEGWLCNARVLSPPEDKLIQGGQVDSATGEYSEQGIEEANRDRDIWTAGALRFWQRSGGNRQTVVYAVSVMHAYNLADVFNDAGIPAGVLESNTPDAERADLIDRFRKGNLKALVNVAVATEGFDLPDAACVLMTRPTMSLALYLQMVGRGLRPKPDSGDCVVLDMAGNSLRHGLPEKDREWSLKARGDQTPGDAPLIRCEHCEALSPAGNHFCGHCKEPFGEDCGRCGAWRAWKRWSRKTMCGQDHELVCDLCHKDAHIEANLPVTEELEELAKMTDDDELSPYRDPFLKNMLEEERRRISGASDDRKAELQSSVEQLESDLRDDERMYRRFEQYRDSLPDDQRPYSRRQNANLYVEWEDKLEAELKGWKEALTQLESQTVDGQLVVRNVRELLLRLLEAEAREAGLIHRVSVQTGAPQQRSAGSADAIPGEWLNFAQLGEWIRTSYTIDIRPQLFRDPQGNEIAVSGWSGLLRETAEFLIRDGFLNENHCPIPAGDMSNKYMIHREPIHKNGQRFRKPQQLSSGLWLDPVQGGGDRIARLGLLLVQRIGLDQTQFQVQLSKSSQINTDMYTRNQEWPPRQSPIRASITAMQGPGEWKNLIELGNIAATGGIKPQRFLDPKGNEIPVSGWTNLFKEMAEWFIAAGLLTRDMCPVAVGGMHLRYLIHERPVHPTGRSFSRPVRLSNDSYLDCDGQVGWKRIVQLCAQMAQKFGEDPTQFHVQLSL